MEQEAFVTGAWSSFTALEQQLTLPELGRVVEAVRKDRFDIIKGFGMIMGVEFKDEESEDTASFQDIVERVQGKAKNSTGGFDQMGIGVVRIGDD